MNAEPLCRSRIMVVALLVSLLGLTACHDDDNSSGPPLIIPTIATISGQAVKGPIANGTVTAFEVSGGAKGAVLATATTDDSGDYTLSIEAYTGSVLLEVTGGSYIDEATGNTVTLSGVLQAVVSDVAPGSTLSTQITPLTTLAATRALNMAGGLTTANINAANQEVGDYFGGIDLLGTQPVDPTVAGSAGGASQAAIDYGLILGGLSGQAQALGLTDAQELIEALAADFADGIFDGLADGTPIDLNGESMDPATGTSGLGTAIGAFSDDTELNVSGGEVTPELVTALQNAEPPAAPAGITATPGNGQVTVSWTAVSGASSYVVYLSDDAGVSKSVFSASQTATSSPAILDGLTNGTPYYVVVTAVNLTGESVESASATATPASSATTYTVGGTLSGLTGTGLVLRNKGGDDLSVSADGTFVFDTAISGGGTYAVTVSTQPSGQTCAVGNGSGTVGSANVTSVTVTCVDSGGGAGTATVNITSATPASGNGSLVVDAVTAEVDGTLTRVSVSGTINGLSALLQLYYTTATPTDVTNISLQWDGISNVVFKNPPDSGEVFVDKANNQVNLDVVGLNDADGFIITTPTKFADVSATINVTLP